MFCWNNCSLGLIFSWFSIVMSTILLQMVNYHNFYCVNLQLVVVFHFLLTIYVYNIYHLWASLCFSIISWALTARKTSFLSAFIEDILEK